MKTPPLVSAITVNYHQEEVTCELLASLQSCGYPSLEVILIDNEASSDQSPLFQKFHPGVKVFPQKENLGFAGANNLGMSYAEGEYFFLINNDAIVPPGAIEALVLRLQKPEAGMAGPKIYYYDEPLRIQFAGFTKVHPITGRNRIIGERELDRGQYDQPKTMPYLHGAAMMVRREVVEKAGPMPEVFFLYYEELDWCEQIRRAGYQLYYEPAAAVLHRESVTLGQDSPRKVFYQTRNRIRFMQRNHPFWQFALFSIYYMGVAFPKALWKYRNSREHRKELLRGLREAYC